MAAPSYTEDLTDIDLAESGSTGWTAFNISGGGGGAPAFGADLGMQGAGCWDKAASNAERGLAVNKTPGTGTVAAGVHIFQWGFCATPGITDTLANRGAYIIIGTSTSNFMQFHVEGSNTYGALGRVGKCYVVDYVTTPNTGSIPYRTQNGSPGATPTYFGFGIKTLATAKGSNVGADAVRYGTGAYLTAGELISAGDASDNPCSFTGFQTQNDNNTNRWGILTGIGGSNMELQGTFAIGQNNSGTATLARFLDSDINISLVDTVHSSTTFTQIIIDHASTRCEWNNINISALGTNNPGLINVTSANPTVVITGGVFTDIGTTQLRSNTTADGVTWRRCDIVTAAGADLSNSSILTPNISANTSGLIWNVNTNPDGLLDNMTFSKTSGTAHHAIEFGTAIADGANYTLRGCDFGTDFSATEGGTTGDETFHFLDTTGSITLNLVNCTGNFGYRTAGVAVTIVADPVTAQLTVTDNASPPVPIQNARVFLETADGTGPLSYQDPVTITQTAGTATVTNTAHGFVTGNYVVIRGAAQNGYNKVAQITVTGANTYTYAVDSGTVSPATGSPVESAVIISGLTNASGIISDTRTYSGNQNFKGWARKSSGTPYYQNGNITGTISSTGGFTGSLPLNSDE